jgi:hypothetical protein
MDPTRYPSALARPRNGWSLSLAATVCALVLVPPPVMGGSTIIHEAYGSAFMTVHSPCGPFPVALTLAGGPAGFGSWAFDAHMGPGARVNGNQFCVVWGGLDHAEGSWEPMRGGCFPGLWSLCLLRPAGAYPDIAYDVVGFGGELTGRITLHFVAVEAPL